MLQQCKTRHSAAGILPEHARGVIPGCEASGTKEPWGAPGRDAYE